MSLYQVLDGDREVTVAVERGDEFYGYDAHTGRFHLNRSIKRDYFIDQSNTYKIIDAPTARARIAAGAGSYDGRSVAELLAKHRADPQPMSVDDALGPKADPAAPTPQQRSRARARVVRDNVGQWVTWQSYPRTRYKAARVAASELRTGKVAALRDARGVVEAEVVDRGDTLDVQARLTNT